MKKLFVVAFAAVAIVLASPSKAEAAYADGAALGAGVGFSTYADGNHLGVSWGNLYVTGKFDGIDPVFGVNVGFRSAMLVMSADWWLLKHQLGQVGHADVRLYLGPGVGVGLRMSNEPFIFNVNARLPIGFSWIVKNNWEIFTEVLVSLHVLSIEDHHAYDNDTTVRLFGIRVNNDGGWTMSDSLYAGINVGFRYWF